MNDVINCPKFGGSMKNAVAPVPNTRVSLALYDLKSCTYLPVNLMVIVVVGSSSETVTVCHVPFCACVGSIGIGRFVARVHSEHVPPVGSH